MKIWSLFRIGLILLGLPAMVQAQFTYTTNNGSITISGGYTAFSFCYGLTNLTIPNRVISIGDFAFGYCSGLTNITIGTNVANIGYQSFQACAGVGELIIPNSVTSIGHDVFESCVSLVNITVEGHNSFYSSVGGVLFNKSQTTLIEAPGGLVGSYAIPDSVTEIVDGAFSDCGHLTAMIVGVQNNYYSSTNGVLFDKLQTTLVQFPGAVGGSYVVPNGVTFLGTAAFS